MKDCEWGGNISVGKICEKSINYVFLFSYLYREIRTKELQGIVCTFISEFDLPAATKHSSSGAFAKSTTLPFATLSLLTIEQCRNTKGKVKDIGLYSRNEAELSLF